MWNDEDLMKLNKCQKMMWNDEDLMKLNKDNNNLRIQYLIGDFKKQASWIC